MIEYLPTSNVVLIMSNSTDWISAVSDVVMAFAAVSGALTARSWFKRKTAESAHNLAMNFKNDLEDLTGRVGADFWTIAGRIHYFDSHLSERCERAEAYEIEYREFIRTVIRYKTTLNRIQTSGLKVLQVDFINQVIKEVGDFYAAVVAIFRYQRELRDETTFTPADIYEEIKTNLKPMSNSIRKHHDKLKEMEFNKLFKS